MESTPVTRPAYSASDSGVATFAITMLVFIAAGGVGYWIASRSMNDWTPTLIGFGLPLIGYAIAVVRGLRMTDRRAKAMIESLQREGLTVTSPVPYADTLKLDALLPHASKWLELIEGRPGLRWIARCPDGRTQLFESLVVVGSGDEASPTFKSVVLREGMPENLFVAFERADARRRAEWMKSDPGRLRTGDATFDSLWLVSGDRTSSRMVLTPEMRAVLAGAPPGEAWVLGNGVLLLNFQSHADARGFAVMRKRLDAVAKLIEALPRVPADTNA